MCYEDESIVIIQEDQLRLPMKSDKSNSVNEFNQMK